jgi:hypothetical protein
MDNLYLDDLEYRIELFKNSGGSKWKNTDSVDDKIPKPSKVKSKRILSDKPEHNKKYRI